MNNIDLASLSSTQGFKILGAAAQDYVGYSVSNAGDVNGDGLSDVIVGSAGANPSGRFHAGVVYVIYGKSGGLNNIDLASFTSAQGFQILGAAANDYTGYADHALSNAGDINGDGLNDIIVGAYGASPNSRSGAGTAYVIYGKSGGLINM